VLQSSHTNSRGTRWLVRSLYFPVFLQIRNLPSPVSRSQAHTHLLVPAAHFCARGFATLLHSPRIEGWAERRETFGCSAEHPWGLHMTRQARRLRGALRPMTRDARLSALHRGGFSPGAALPSPLAPAVLQRRAVAFGSVQRAPRSQVVVPGGRGPGPPEASGYKPPPQDATPRSAFRMSPETPLNERGCESLA